MKNEERLLGAWILALMVLLYLINYVN